MLTSFSPDLIEALLHHENFFITGHIRPDGDSIGSTLALGIALQTLGKTVILSNEECIPETYAFLDPNHLIVQAKDVPSLPPHTVFITVDTAAYKRMGEKTAELKESCRLSINIDHHGTNEQYADINCINATQPATAAIIYELLKTLKISITPSIRDALYVGISTDTGSFKYRGTTAQTMEMGADLIRLGLDVQEINQKIYDENPLRKIRLMQIFLDNLHFEAHNTLAYVTLTAQQKASTGALAEDLDGLIDLIRSIKGVIVAAVLDEIEGDARIHISMRSKDIRANVAEIAQQFGGGGHPLAAGVRIKGSLTEVTDQLLSAIKEKLSLC